MTPANLKNSSPKIGRSQIALLEKLSNAVGVSGNEDAVRQIVEQEIKPFVDDYKVDAMGNLLAFKHADTKDALRVMFAAHMDEVGFMIVAEDGDGLFAFEHVGGMDERQLIAKPVIVGKDRLQGVIGGKPIHLTSAEERHHSTPMNSLRIDVSPANNSKVKVGDYATFGTIFHQSGDSLFGKALDDRLGVVTLIELLKRNHRNIELLFAFTVQEEVGLRGAHVAAYDFKPDIAFVVDSTPAFDFPALEESDENTLYNCKLDAGPAIYISDAGTLSDPRLIRFLVKTAEEHHIAYQFRQPGGGGTDAGAIHKTRAGIPSVSISVPGRYAHSPIMHARVKDWENTLILLDRALDQIDRSILAADR